MSVASDSRTVLVTGANGFVGTSLVDRLSGDSRYRVRAAVRSASVGVEAADTVVVGDIAPATDWDRALRSVDTVIHLAARVHIMRDAAADPGSDFRRVNTLGTLALANAARAAGVRRLIFLSSIKVNGESTDRGRPFTELDEPNPVDAYGVSKREAEVGLGKLAREGGLQIVIIRPPLIYGPGVKANFASLIKLLRSRIPLPLGAIHNRRSFIGLSNITDFIVTCIDHEAAANQTFLVADGEDLSTTDLLRRLGTALGHPPKLLPVPQRILQTSLSLLGKGDLAQRLCGSLQIDPAKARKLLDWKAPRSVDQGLREVAAAELSKQHSGRSN